MKRRKKERRREHKGPYLFGQSFPPNWVGGISFNLEK
jgi:hypothetical protein